MFSGEFDPSSQTSYTAALHEAAHLVVATAVGCQPIKAWISSDPMYPGAATYRMPQPCRNPRLVRAITASAGDVAEIRMWGHVPQRYAHNMLPGYRPPLDQDARNYDAEPGDKARVDPLSASDREYAIKVATEVIDAHWSRILAIADDLQSFGVVTATNIQLKLIRPWELSL
jgi:hypothetical protein